MLRLDVYLRLIRSLTARPRHAEGVTAVPPGEVMVLFADTGSPALRSHPAWQGARDRPRAG